MKTAWMSVLLAGSALGSAHAQAEAGRFAAPAVLPTHHVQANLGAGCHVAVTVPVSEVPGLWGNADESRGGMGVRPVPKRWHSGINSLGFALTCRDKNDPNNPQPSGTYDEATKTWRKNPEWRLSDLKDAKDAYLRRFAKEIVAASRVYDIKTPNAEGWADTDDDMNGEESNRLRRMGFCVYHGTKALCGSGNVAYLHDGRKGDLTPQALKIIRSIEFLD